MRTDKGSILPLAVGLLALSLVVSMFFAEQLGVQFQTLQVKQLADVIALQVASDLERDQIEPIRNLDYRPAVKANLEQGAQFLNIHPSQYSVTSFDGKTIEARVCEKWRSITGLKLDVFGEVCASSRARAVS